MLVHSVFLSIDGEVNKWHQGCPTIFLRLSRCNCRCLYCDTTYSFTGGTEKSVDIVFEEIQSISKIKKVTITGGEPLLQSMEVKELLDKLVDFGYNVSVETNGTLPPIKSYINHPQVSWVYDYKLSSSGETSKMSDENFLQLCEGDFVKFVIMNARDFQEALTVQNRLEAYPTPCRATFAYSPVHGVFDPAILIEQLLTYTEHKQDIVVNLQLHKLIWPTCGVSEER